MKVESTNDAIAGAFHLGDGAVGPEEMDGGYSGAWERL